MSRRRVFLYTMAIVSFFNSSPRETLSVARRARPPSRSSSPRARVVARRRALPIVARRRRLFRQHHRERVRETARAEHRRPRVALVTTVVPHRVFPQRRQGVVRRRRARRGRAVARGRRCRHPRRARGDAPRGDASRRDAPEGVGVDVGAHVSDIFTPRSVERERPWRASLARAKRAVDMGGLYVVKRDGREEPVAFDKITARIKKLAYGLSQEFCDPVRDATRPRTFVFLKRASDLDAATRWTRRRRG